MLIHSFDSIKAGQKENINRRGMENYKIMGK